jgi:hypothetical protein
MRAGAVDAIEAKEAARQEREYATAIDGRKLRLAERRRGAKPKSKCARR